MPVYRTVVTATLDMVEYVRTKEPLTQEELQQ